MGWSFSCTPETSKDHIARILKENNSTKTRVIAHKAGKTLWMVVAIHTNGLDQPETDRFIVAVLRDRHEGCWGEKYVDEDMGPYEIDCPLFFLTLQPKVHGEYSQKWRERVIAHHSRPKPQVGEVYQIGEKRYKVLSLKPGRARQLENGQVYRTSAAQLRRSIKIS